MYNNDKNKIKSLLDVWKVIEILTPSPSEDLKLYLKDREELKGEKLRRKEYKNGLETLYLFEDISSVIDERPEENDDYEIWWKVYIGAINWGVAESDIQAKVTKSIGKDPSEGLIKKSNIIVPALGFIMSNDKRVMEESITLSTAAWALGKITSDGFGKNNITQLVNFERDSFNIKQAIKGACFSEDNFKIIFDLQSVVAEQLGIHKDYFVDTCNICVRKIVKKAKNFNKKNTGKENAPEGDRKYPELDMFNSFFLEEIQNVKGNVDTFKEGSAISKYLGESDKPDFIDVLKDKDALDELIYSDKVCHARWPHCPKKSPALLQAIAANSMLKKDREAGLFAINGPPGTGKTTMMFNVIANLYVERAEQLAKLDSPRDAFDFRKKKTYEAANRKYYISEPISDLQGYEIVVASSNNAAVENISNEITLLCNTDENFNREVDYFKWLNNEKDEENNWGLFAAVLGNWFNRNKFINKIWKEENISMQDDKANEKSLKPPFYKHKTMFQYLNMMKDFGTSKYFQHCSDELKKHIPKYGFTDEEFSENKWKETGAEDLKNEWRQTCDRFNKKLKHIKNIHQVFLKLKELKKEKFRQLQSLPSVKIEELESQKKELENDNVDCDLIIKEKSHEYSGTKLSFIQIILEFLRLRKFEEHHKKCEALLNEQNDCRKKIKENNKNIKKINNKINYITAIQAKIDKIKNEIKGIEGSGDEQLKEIYRQFNKNLDLYDQESEEKQRENHMMTPYHSVGFEKLKNELFMEAIKLHKLVVDGNATIFKNLLYAFDNILKNSVILEKPKEFSEFFKKVWRGFFMFMPVVSTTFHSFGKLFKNFGHNDIGWLIIDEAGQASPQCSVGAIYRSNNAIAVGDPLQTEPISIVGKMLIDALFGEFGLQNEHWSPLSVSVQNIADRNSLYRTEYEKYMIGFPLLVHRRCNDPMFTICNELSYNGRMLYATNTKDHDGIIKILGKSRWINIVDNYPQKKLSIAEYTKLKEMLVILIEKKGIEFLKNVYVITLFKDFAKHIKYNLLNDINGSTKQTNRDDNFLKKWKKNNVGTVHSFQGKENDIVFFLLGAQCRYQNCAKPLLDKTNVLNVAISRAKIAIYVIGDEEGLKDKFDNIIKVHTYMV